MRTVQVPTGDSPQNLLLENSQPIVDVCVPPASFTSVLTVPVGDGEVDDDILRRGYG